MTDNKRNAHAPDLARASEDLLLHTTGNRPDSPEPGRNMLVCPKDSAMSELVTAGLLESRGYWKMAKECAWAATPAGIERALAIRKARTPKLSRGKRRYNAWLDLSDAIAGLTFHQFLTDPQFKEYRR